MDNIKIRFANKNDIKNIRTIWLEAFGETESFDKYMTFVKIEEIIKVVELNNKEIVSMLSLIPCTYRKLNRTYDGYYLYAAATKKHEKNKNYMGILLKFIQEECKTLEKDFIFTIPANDSLFEYYYKRGFTEDVFGAKEIVGIDSEKWVKRSLCKEDISSIQAVSYNTINIEFPTEIAAYFFYEVLSSKKCNILYGYKEKKLIGYLIKHNTDLLVYEVTLPVNAEIKYKLIGKVYWAKGVKYPIKINGFIPF